MSQHSVSDCIFKDQMAHTSGDVVSITQVVFTTRIALVPIWGWFDLRALFRSEQKFRTDNGSNSRPPGRQASALTTTLPGSVFVM
jgi:hypothetical protein